MIKASARFTSFIKSHKLLCFILSGLIIIFVLLAVISVTTTDDDGVDGDSSQAYDASLTSDQHALSSTDSFKISNYLPISSPDPSYKISYLLDSDEEGNYTFSLTLYALSASGRSAMIARLLSENFGKYDPLDYNIELLNYYNPFTDYNLEDLKSNNLPPNITNSNLYSFDDSPYSVRTLTHTLYDGTTNTYRYILENGEPKTMPQLLFTYVDLPFLDHQMVKSLNTLE